MTFTPITASFHDENMSQTMSSTLSSKKRKRPSDHAGSNSKRSSLAATNGNAEALNGAPETYSDSSNDFHHLTGDQTEQDISTTAAAALTAHLNSEQQDLSFGTGGSGPDDRPLDDSFGMESSMQSNAQGSPFGLSSYAAAPSLRDTLQQKPAVGTEEWHKVRRDNHKEVERRRRETINEGINELAKIVPGSEKNKGSILQGAVTYINELKAKDELAEQKKSTEKAVLEQAIQVLMTQNQSLKDRNEELELQGNIKDSLIEDLRKSLNKAEAEAEARKA